MKINKEEWREIMKNTSLADLHHKTDMRDIYIDKCRESMALPDYEPSLVTHPTHYNVGKHEVIDVIEDWGLDFHCGNAIKYIARHKHKENPKQDIEKAIWYLQRYLENNSQLEVRND